MFAFLFYLNLTSHRILHFTSSLALHSSLIALVVFDVHMYPLPASSVSYSSLLHAPRCPPPHTQHRPLTPNPLLAEQLRSRLIHDHDHDLPLPYLPSSLTYRCIHTRAQPHQHTTKCPAFRNLVFYLAVYFSTCEASPHVSLSFPLVHARAHTPFVHTHEL